MTSPQPVNAIEFFILLGSHTKNLTLKLEHLQLENYSLSVPLPSDDSESNQQLKYQLNLPQGPLYGRVTIEAESRLRIKATKWLAKNTWRMWALFNESDLFSFYPMAVIG